MGNIENYYKFKTGLLTLKLINDRLISSAHDISDGGLAVAIAESCIMNRNKKIGCTVNLDFASRKDFVLFSESQARILVSLPEQNMDAFKKILGKFDYTVIGVTGGDKLTINNAIKIGLDEISDKYFNSISKIMSD